MYMYFYVLDIITSYSTCYSDISKYSAIEDRTGSREPPSVDPARRKAYYY